MSDSKETVSASGSNRLAWRRIRSLAGWVLIGICAFFLYSRMRSSADVLRAADLRPGLLTLAAVICLAAGQFATGTITFVLLRRLNPQLRWARVLRIHFLSQLAKYLPAGGILNITSQTWSLGRLPGIGLMAAGSAVALMCGLVCAGSLTVYGLAELTLGLHVSAAQVLAVFALPAGAIIASAPLRSWPLADRVLSRLKLTLPVANRSKAELFWESLLLSGLTLASWALFGLGAVALAADVVPLTGAMAVRLLSAFALSWLAGFLAVLVPAGLGVREVTMMLMLQPVLPPPWPTLLPVASRLCWLLGDVLNGAIGWGLGRFCVPCIEDSQAGEDRAAAMNAPADASARILP